MVKSSEPGADAPGFHIHSGTDMTDHQKKTYEASDRILTIPNVISFIRLCLLPVYLVLLFNGNNLPAAIIFAVAAATDFLDGMIARATNSVSKLGQVLDPLVDRLAMLTGIIALAVLGRLPVWITVIVILRDVLFVIFYALLMKKVRVRIPVIMLGKVATTFFFVGIAFLILNLPILAGFGITDISWLPGFNGLDHTLGIWFIYVGLILGACSTCYYIRQAILAVTGKLPQNV